MIFTVDLENGAKMVVAAEQIGPALVSDDLTGKIDTLATSIEQISRDVLGAIRRAGPTKATVELGFGLAVETGQLVALLGKAKGDAAIKVTLEWSRADRNAATP